MFSCYGDSSAPCEPLPSRTMEFAVTIAFFPYRTKARRAEVTREERVFFPVERTGPPGGGRPAATLLSLPVPCCSEPNTSVKIVPADFEKSLELRLYAVDPAGQTSLRVAMGCTVP